MSLTLEPDTVVVEPEGCAPAQRIPAADGRFQPRSLPLRLWCSLWSGLAWVFGFASLLAALAVLAAIPLLNFMALGYLLEASGRVARSGRLRDGFIDISRFGRIGSLVLGTWLCLLVPRLVASFATDAWLIDPDGRTASAWRVAQVAVTAAAIGHVLAAWYCGGKLRHFFWPLAAPFQVAGWLLTTGPVARVARRRVGSVWPALATDLFRERPMAEWFFPAMLWAGVRRGRMLAEARDAVWEFTTSLRLPQYFWLGLRGFVGGFFWLLVPSLMLMAGTSGSGPPAIVVGYLGAALMVAVILHLPFLQTHFAAENRFAALFERQAVWHQFRRAPLAYWLALFLTLLLALPLYLFKIEPVLPEELQWTVTLFFVAFIYPARLATGWAVGRARRRERPRWTLVSFGALALAIPLAAFYVFIVFFSQYTSFLGPASILEQHAFLLPAPFFSR